MQAKTIKIRGELVDRLNDCPGKSYSDKVEFLLKNQKTEGSNIDYDHIELLMKSNNQRIKSIVEDVLIEFKEGRL